MSITQEQAIAIADKMYDLPTTFDKDTSEYKRYEDVLYRWRLYNKDGIYVNLTVYRIEESKLSYRVLKAYADKSKEVTVAAKKDLSSLADTVDIAYVEEEKLWYQQYAKNKWMIDRSLNYIYAPCYYIEYFNDNKKIHFRSYFNPDLPCWKTIEAAKQELGAIEFDQVDLIADEEATFFFVDKQCSHLFDPQTFFKNKIGERYSFADEGYKTFITPTSLVPAPVGGQAFMILLSQAINEEMPTKIKDYEYTTSAKKAGAFLDGIVEGVQANGGKSRLVNLLQEWSTLEKSSDTNYVKLADATTSGGYASLVQNSNKEGA